MKENLSWEKVHPHAAQSTERKLDCQHHLMPGKDPGEGEKRSPPDQRRGGRRGKRTDDQERIGRSSSQNRSAEKGEGKGTHRIGLLRDT